MKKALGLIACICSVCLALASSHAADVGDINGDGRVSYADAVWYARWILTGDPGFQPAPGSNSFEEAFPCTGSAPGLLVDRLIDLEGVRRASTSPLPHFLERWPASAAFQPPPPDPDEQVLIELLPVVHRGGEAKITLQARVTNFIPLLGLELILRGRGLELRAPAEYDRQGPFAASGEATLLSRGELLVYGLSGRGESWLEIGEHELSLPASLVKGTPPGKYSLELADGSEGVAVETGAVVVPVWTAGEIEVVDEISVGAALPFPPLVFDETERRILGATELRVTEPEGRPGSEVVVRVQLRTDRPVNKLAFWLRFDGWALHCNGLVPLLRDPDDGVVHLEDYLYSHYFNAHPYWGEHWGFAELSYSAVPRGYHLYEDSRTAGSRPAGLKYIAPLGDWVDVAELSFLVRDGASGKESTPIVLPSAPAPFAPAFAPYADSMDSASGMWGYGDGRPHPCETQAAWWTTGTEFRSGLVTVLGDGEQREPAPPMAIEDAGFRFAIGDASGQPGQVVKVPLSVTGDVDFWWISLVLAYDPVRLDLVGYEIDYFDPDGAPLVSLLTSDEPRFSNPVDCVRNGAGVITKCRYGYPWQASLRGPWVGDGVPPGVLIAFLVKNARVGDADPEVTEDQRFWSQGRAHEVGRAVFRIREDATPGIANVRDAMVDWHMREHAVPTRLSSGAKPLIVLNPDLQDTFERYDVPALRADPGKIRILGDIPFRRGDSNQDGAHDLSDAVRTLGTLFLGAGALTCPDAADANDDGAINITDAVYSLDHLFRGGPAPPMPYPESGADPTGDDLRCDG